MRASIDIDGVLMRQALRATGLPTQKAVVEEGLRLLLKVHRQKAILGLGGKIAWESDLGTLRRGRT
jgi:Arc/MetJ family transcription regulator